MKYDKEEKNIIDAYESGKMIGYFISPSALIS